MCPTTAFHCLKTRLVICQCSEFSGWQSSLGRQGLCRVLCHPDGHGTEYPLEGITLPQGAARPWNVGQPGAPPHLWGEGVGVAPPAGLATLSPILIRLGGSLGILLVLGPQRPCGGHTCMGITCTSPLSPGLCDLTALLQRLVFASSCLLDCGVPEDKSRLKPASLWEASQTSPSVSTMAAHSQPGPQLLS